MNRASSKKGFDDSDSEAEESRYSRRSKFSNRKASERRLTNDYDSEEERYSRQKKKTVEESVRQARTMLKTVKKTERNEDGVTVEVQQVMNSELSEMIAQLKKQKDEAEQRLRNSETEATRLRIEKEAHARHIAELENENIQTHHDLLLTQQEAQNIHAHNTLAVAETEAETIRVAAELEQVRKEREAMSKMISKLEKAKGGMESKLHEIQDEASLLREENAMHQVNMAEHERRELETKLASIQQARDDLQNQLMEAEMEAKSLKAMKKSKTHDIRVERSSAHVRYGYVDQMEAERHAISTDLKKAEADKTQMKEMLAKLDASRYQLASLLEGEGLEEQPFNNSYRSSRSGLSTRSGLSRDSSYQPALSTIQSPRADSTYHSQQESIALRDKRARARRSEDKLRRKMEKSRSSRSMGSVGSMSGSFDNGLSGGSYHGNAKYGNSQW